MYQFDYIKNNEDEIVLEYSKEDLELQGGLYFTGLVGKVGFDEAIEVIFAGKWKEASNKLAHAMANGSIQVLLPNALLDNKDVIERAENAAIEIYEGI